MKKIIKAILLLAAVTTGAGTLVSCSDDDLPAAEIAGKALHIASEICVYTNDHISTEKL